MTVGRPGVLLLAGVLSAAALAAQNPPPAPLRPAASDSAGPTRADSVALPDSLSPDSFRPELPRLGPPPGPLARGGRVVFDQDALRFLGALTLGELLAHVPGVFLVRLGWFGQPEAVAYAGQGASSVEIFWDGFALDPLGEDSTGHDLSRFALGLVNRVEVEVLASQLRVYLFSDAQPVRRPRTETSFATGDAETNTYRVRYLNRWAPGTGLGIGVNWFGTEGPVTSPGDVADLTAWLKGTWTPSDQAGVEYQVLRYSLERDSLFPLAGGTALPGVEIRRTDAFVRGHVGTRPDGLGLRFDALLGGSSYRDSAGARERSLAQGAAFASYRTGRWSAELVTRFRDARTPFDIRLRGAWAPFRALAVAAYATRRTHLGDRHSLEAGGTAELRPLAAFAFRSSLRWRDAVAAPADPADAPQRTTDWSVGAGLEFARARLDLSLERHGEFVAPVSGTFSRFLPRGTSAAGTTVTGTFDLRPTAYVSVGGWYRHPLGRSSAAFEPPHHSRVWLRFRSRFLPTFRRGVFDVVGQVGAEGWSRGVAGATGAGAEIALRGETVFDWLLEVRLVGAVLFWTLRNSQPARYALVPGFEMPRALQRFGVRWEFTN